MQTTNAKPRTGNDIDPSGLFMPTCDTVVDWIHCDEMPSWTPGESAFRANMPVHAVTGNVAPRLALFIDEHGYFARIVLDIIYKQAPSFLPGRAIHVLVHFPSRGHGCGIPKPDREPYRLGERGLHADSPDNDYRAAMKQPAWIPRAGRFSIGRRFELLRDDRDYLEEMRALVTCNGSDEGFPPGLGLSSTVRLQPVEKFTVHRLDLHVQDQGIFASLRLDVELDPKPARFTGKVMHVLHRVPVNFMTSEPCSECGQGDPAMFFVPDDTWNLVVDARSRKKIVCYQCFQRLARNKRRELRGYEVLFLRTWASYIVNVPGSVKLGAILHVKNR